MKVTCTFLIFVFCVGLNNGLNQADKKKLEGLIKDLINANSDGNAPGNGPPVLPFIPGFARLSFHDCVGGCNGCINLDNPENAGLETYLWPLHKVYTENKLSGTISRADFIALAGVTAITMAAERVRCGRRCKPPIPNITYKWGRKDCGSTKAPLTSANLIFPSGHGDARDTLDFFKTEFDFTDRESVAILGIHTLGKASRFNSGFQGRWVGSINALTNDFYKDLINAKFNWTQGNIARRRQEPRYQWNSRNTGGPRLMLNADMCLLKDFSVSSSGKASCTYTSCKLSKTAAVVKEFAGNNNLWVTEFAKVYQKMINHGNEDTLKNVL